MSEKSHWFSFSFSGKVNGLDGQASAYIGYPNKLITIPRITAAKQAAGINKSAVMMACCYMGYATKAEIEEQKP